MRERPCEDRRRPAIASLAPPAYFSEEGLHRLRRPSIERVLSLRFLFRLVGLLALVAAVIAGTIDAIASVAAGALRLTSLGAAWTNLAPVSLATLRTDVGAHAGAWLVEPALDWLLSEPVVVVLGVLSLLFYCAGYRRQRVTRRRFALR